MQKHSKFEGLVYISFPKGHLFGLNWLAYLTGPSSLSLPKRAVLRSSHEGYLPRRGPLRPQRMMPSGLRAEQQSLNNSWAWGLPSPWPQIRLILCSPHRDTSHTSPLTDSSLTSVTLQWDIHSRVLLNLLLVTEDHSYFFKNLQSILFSYKAIQMCLVTQSCFAVCDPMGCSLPFSFVHAASPGKTTGVGCHFLLQDISPTTHGSNLDFLYGMPILYQLSY